MYPWEEPIMELVIGCTTRPYAAWSFAKACERIAAAGYTDVALFRNKGELPVRSDTTPDQIAATRKILADNGLVPSMLIGSTQLDLGLEAALDDYKRLIDHAADMGITWLLDCGTGNEAHFDAYFELMRRAAPHAQEAGVHITMKPHGGISLTAEDLLNAYDQVHHPAFGICYDPGNIIYYTKGEHRPETDLERVAPTVSTAIIKDCVLEGGVPDVMVTPGEGLVDFPRVLGGLVEGGFTGPLYVECVGGEELEDLDRNVRSTLCFVRDILAGL